MPSYSNKTLISKLGITEGSSLFFINTPDDYKKLLGKLPLKTKMLKKIGSNIDFIHFFTLTKKDLKKNFPKLKKALKKDGMLWVSWPKGKNYNTDLKENIIRDIGLEYGLVDVNVIAINDTWSGLKFVYRMSDR